MTTPSTDTARRACPDDGACHHKCTAGCFRVRYCGPLSGVYPDDRWPESVRCAVTADRLVLIASPDSADTWRTVAAMPDADTLGPLTVRADPDVPPGTVYVYVDEGDHLRPLGMFTHTEPEPGQRGW